MTRIPKSSSEVYLDANFLIAYLTSPHSDYANAQKLMASLIVNKNKLVFSALTIDETMLGIKNTLQQQEKEENLKKGKSYKDYIEDIREAVTLIISDSNFRVTQFDDPILGCTRAVDNVDNYLLKPRDAFHLSYMQDQSIKHIATNDGKFDSVSECVRISFN